MILSMFGPSPGMNSAQYVEAVGKFPSAVFEVSRCETEPPTLPSSHPHIHFFQFKEFYFNSTPLPSVDGCLILKEKKQNPKTKPETNKKHRKTPAHSETK